MWFLTSFCWSSRITPDSPEYAWCLFWRWALFPVLLPLWGVNLTRCYLMNEVSQQPPSSPSRHVTPTAPSHSVPSAGARDGLRQRRGTGDSDVTSSVDTNGSPLAARGQSFEAVDEVVETQIPQHDPDFVADPPTTKETGCTWDDAGKDPFSVRGKNYMKDGIKVRSLPAVMQLEHVHMFNTAPGETVGHICEKPGSFLQRLRAAGDNRFVLAIVFQFAPHHMTCYFTMAPGAAKQCDDSFRDLWALFLDGDDKFRNARWKVIPTVIDGPWIVKRTVGAKPALLGNKLTQKYIRGDRYLEIDCDVTSSRTATMLVQVLKEYTTAFVIDLGFVIQGEKEDHLPERLLGGFRLSNLNVVAGPPCPW
eukprot:CAMPEP_0114567180 /NCGR_PEP_ID=MMETSP0114-20121206/15331_1 /TAXON_ID=31324 /ORGANISM="Goniomonas sp, Strain m" /LENGTH=363 /DNA_ID=CAMNT_0001753727 /DNA_START=22 /DNA_END=1113 /DNA_ORIENTATION=+